MGDIVDFPDKGVSKEVQNQKTIVEIALVCPECEASASFHYLLGGYVKCVDCNTKSDLMDVDPAFQNLTTIDPNKEN